MSKVYIYCPRGSTGAFALNKHLGATRLRRFDGINFWDKPYVRPTTVEPGSTIICWGATLSEMDDVRVLNSMNRSMNKFEEVNKLQAAGVATIKAVKSNSSPTYMRSLGYIPRSKYHQGGLDLLGMEEERYDYWTVKLNFVKEFRVHSFAGKSIRAGQKVLRDGFHVVSEAEWHPNTETLAHPWVRGWDGGWKLSYKDFRSTPEMRDLAHRAVSAMGLVFGAVDMGQTEDGKLYVLEVNTAPGIEGGTIDCYVRTINKWIANEPVEGA